MDKIGKNSPDFYIFSFKLIGVINAPTSHLPANLPLSVCLSTCIFNQQEK